MKKRKSILLSILILCGVLFVADFVLFLSELISELMFFIIGAIALLPFIVCVVLFTRLLKLIKANPKTDVTAASVPANEGAGVALPLDEAELNKKTGEDAEEEKKAREAAEQDMKMRELYEILGLKVQYNEDGSIKDLYQLLGIEPTFDEDGNRVETIYEQLGIAPRFDENGNEIPQVFVIKNGVKKIAKVDTTSRVMTRKVPVEEQEIIVIRETLKKKLEEAQKSGDKVQEQNIRKILEKTQKEGKGEKDDKFEEKRPDKDGEKKEGGEEKSAPKKKDKGAAKSSSGDKSSGSTSKKSAAIKYAAPKSNGKAVSPGTLKVGKSDGKKGNDSVYGSLINGFFNFITPKNKPNDKKPEEKQGGSKPEPGIAPKPDKPMQYQPSRDNVHTNFPRMNPYHTPINNIPTLTRNEPQEGKGKEKGGEFALGNVSGKTTVPFDEGWTSEKISELGLDFVPSEEVKRKKKPENGQNSFGLGFEADRTEAEKKQAEELKKREEENEQERQPELGKNKD